MKEQRAAARRKMMMMMKRAVSSTHVAAVVGQGQIKRKEVTAGAGATSECRAAEHVVEEEEEEEEDEDEDEANEGEEREEETEEPRGESQDDLDAFEALFKSLSSSSPALHLDTSYSPFSPSLSLLSRASTPGPLTPILPEPEFRLELDLEHALPSPAISSVSSRSYDTSAPPTPTSPLGFPTTHHTVDEAAPVTVTPRLHLRPRPHPRTQFRSLSASITARSPLSFSFPLSLSLPLAGRRASSLGTGMHRYMVQQNDDRAGGATARVAGEDGKEVGEGEDPFGTHGGAYYAPGAREALVLGDAYDLTAWAWACDCSPYRRTKERKRHVQTGPITKASGAAIADGGDDDGTTMKSGNKSGSVYGVPIHATSAPQLSCAQRPDRELEYLQALANATARGRVPRPPARVGTRDRAPGYRSGIRPLLLPKKLGLPGSGAPGREMDMAKVTMSGGCERQATGWELDLERGVSDRRHVAKV